MTYQVTGEKGRALPEPEMAGAFCTLVGLGSDEEKEPEVRGAASKGRADGVPLKFGLVSLFPT